MAPNPTPGLGKDVALAYLCVGGILLSANVLPVPVFFQMLPITLLIIYIGAKGSIPTGSEKVVTEQLQTKDVYMFPIMGSCMLFSLYCVYKFLPTFYVNILVKAYFFFFGCIVLAAKIHALVSQLLPTSLKDSLTASPFMVDLRRKKDVAVVPEASSASSSPSAAPANDHYFSFLFSEPHIEITALDVLCYFLASLVGVWYLMTNHWMANNIFGIVFSLQGIEMIALGSFFNGCILLSGLFFYDIFWVFGTEVMVTVAKSFDAPIKLLFPQPGFMPDGVTPSRPSMLGLGDIVIPGIFIALLLRFDHSRRQALSLQSQAIKGTDFVSRLTAAYRLQPYFFVNLVGYFLGLTTTLFVMYSFKAAQPALLYLVPGCLGAAFLTAFLRGELPLLWHFNEEPAPADAKQVKLGEALADPIATAAVAKEGPKIE